MEIGEAQNKFADIIWDNEPVGSGELVKICEKELNWKKPTTYTVLRKLCEKGIFVNEGGCVRSLIDRESFYAMKSERIVSESYSGSLPMFIAAFTQRNKLSEEELDEIQRMIDEFRKE